MMTRRGKGFRASLVAGVGLMFGLLGVTPARAQYPYGPGFAYGAGYAPVGYGVGYGYPAYGFGYAAGFPGYGPGPVAFSPGFGTITSGYSSPFFPGSYGPGVPGYGPTGIGYANPLFGLGLSPLAVQTAIAERALVRGSQSVVRQPTPIRYGVSSTVTPAR